MTYISIKHGFTFFGTTLGNTLNHQSLFSVLNPKTGLVKILMIIGKYQVFLRRYSMLNNQEIIMGIEYFIIGISRDGAPTQEDVLELFSPYWTEKEENYYFLDYGKEVYQGLIVHNECHFNIDFHEDNLAVKGVTIFKPCSDVKLEQAIFQLIYKFPMFVTYPSEPLLIITANFKCTEMIKEQYPELIENLTVVSSFEEYNSLS